MMRHDFDSFGKSSFSQFLLILAVTRGDSNGKMENKIVYFNSHFVKTKLKVKKNCQRTKNALSKHAALIQLSKMYKMMKHFILLK